MGGPTIIFFGPFHWSQLRNARAGASHKFPSIRVIGRDFGVLLVRNASLLKIVSVQRVEKDVHKQAIPSPGRVFQGLDQIGDLADILS